MPDLKIYNLIVFICFLLLFPGTATLAEQSVQTPTDIKVAIAQWPPWKIIDGKHYGGIDVEILRKVEHYADVRFRFVECPWRRCLDLLKDGQVDLITSFSKRPDRVGFAEYIGEAYVTGSIVFYSLKDKGPLIREYQDLYQGKVGSVKGSAYFKQFDMDKEINKTELTSTEPLFQMLATGRLPVVIGYETVCDYLIKIHGHKDRFEKSPLRINGQASYFAFSKKSKIKKLIPELTDVINRMTKNGEMRKIIDTYIEGVKESGTEINVMK